MLASRASSRSTPSRSAGAIFYQGLPASAAFILLERCNHEDAILHAHRHRGRPLRLLPDVGPVQVVYNPYAGNYYGTPPVNPYVGGAAVVRNPYTGTTAATTAAYNPYTGGAAREGTAYNPSTGASARRRRLPQPLHRYEHRCARLP